MVSKCPPGVICIENMTLTLAIIVFGIIGYVVYVKSNSTIHLDISNLKLPTPNLSRPSPTHIHENTKNYLTPTPTRQK